MRLTENKLRQIIREEISKNMISEVWQGSPHPPDLRGDAILHMLEHIEERIEKNCSFYSMIADAVDSSEEATNLKLEAGIEYVPVEEYKKILGKMKQKYPNFEDPKAMREEYGEFAYYLSHFFRPNAMGLWGRAMLGRQEWNKARARLRVPYSPAFHSCRPGPEKDTEISPRKGGTISGTSTDWSDMNNPVSVIRDRKTGKLVRRELTPDEEKRYQDHRDIHGW